RSIFNKSNMLQSPLIVISYRRKINIWITTVRSLPGIVLIHDIGKELHEDATPGNFGGEEVVQDLLHAPRKIPGLTSNFGLLDCSNHIFEHLGGGLRDLGIKTDIPAFIGLTKCSRSS